MCCASTIEILRGVLQLPHGCCCCFFSSCGATFPPYSALMAFDKGSSLARLLPTSAAAAAAAAVVAGATCQVELQSELSSYGIHTQAVDRYIVTQSRQVRCSNVSVYSTPLAAVFVQHPPQALHNRCFMHLHFSFTARAVCC
jgi:hypothetical protein